MPRGGARVGAGRKGTGRKRAVFYLTGEEEAACRGLIEKMRNNTELGLIELSAPESEEQIITVATDERIMQLYRAQEGMTKGKYKFIADALNSRFEYDATESKWTEESIRQQINKLKKQ